MNNNPQQSIDEILNKYAPDLTDREHVKLRDALLEAIKAANPKTDLKYGGYNKCIFCEEVSLSRDEDCGCSASIAVVEKLEEYEQNLVNLFGLEG